MKYLIALIFLLCANSGLSQDLKPIKENFYLKTTECKATLVDLRSGNLNVVEGDIVDAYCEKDTDKMEMACEFIDKNKKPFNKQVFSAGASSGHFYLAADRDEIIMNLTSENFIMESNININNGLVCGKKICTGVFMLESALAQQKNLKGGNK